MSRFVGSIKKSLEARLFKLARRSELARARSLNHFPRDESEKIGEWWESTPPLRVAQKYANADIRVAVLRQAFEENERAPFLETSLIFQGWARYKMHHSVLNPLMTRE